ncbi:hypothetical protein TpMuguga_05g00026 (apicoplast) [Theileria parva strain Muguga]|uniref:Uncharacterized protein n=1 Tax=Theileria parva TaxID=5875 RepID=Q4MY97_THEPA|nr:hypothetical protein TpMuguga_05g00026 [Theileria parva strain Muguga]|eukprot:XP_762695.1 hypothetical protein (apicoplast) [Theileria parva strain Muguga]
MNRLKNNFKYTNNNKDKFLNLNRKGDKIYFNVINDIYFKKHYKFNKFMSGYKYCINLSNFNSLYVKFTIINKRNREYVNLVKYLNVLNSNIIFLKTK